MNRPTPHAPEFMVIPPTNSEARTPELWTEADRISPRVRLRLPAHAGDWYAAMKPAVDFLAALALLVPILPAVALAWALVKLTSRGPGFYVQTRTGRGGLPYRIIKIRSMHHRVEEATGGPKWSQLGDDRIFGMGKFLRKTHFDELPQLFNVLRGEMSLVGPRPERPEVIASKGLCDEVPGYDVRMVAKPGITGLAQLQMPADSDILSVRRKVYYDLYYIANRSLWFDARICMATVAKAAGVGPTWLRRLFFLPAPDAVLRQFLAVARPARRDRPSSARLQPVHS